MLECIEGNVLACAGLGADLVRFVREAREACIIRMPDGNCFTADCRPGFCLDRKCSVTMIPVNVDPWVFEPENSACVHCDDPNACLQPGDWRCHDPSTTSTTSTTTSSTTTTTAFRITDVQPVVIQSGAARVDLMIQWAGTVAFPITMRWTTPQYPSGWRCDPIARTFTASANPLVATAFWCCDAGVFNSVPRSFASEILLTDATNETAEYPVNWQCVGPKIQPPLCP
ncbi:MAG TPA: hypothetical protein VKA21_01050 [Candidatus Binatia bacterium]|nr:hypothetical protein [Candidatus Binatia bacterium]